jgi:hypothetical protein
MRRTLVCLTFIGLALIIFGASAVLKSKAEGAATVVTPTSPSRCTRLTFGPRPKKTKSKKVIAAATGTAAPGTRCLRLSSGGRPGTILPNTPPNVGIATSTAYIATNANPQVNLKAIACDADGDSILYTYSPTGGRITGDGPTSMWNLNGVAPGTYTVTVEVDDGCGCISFDSSTVTVE